MYACAWQVSKEAGLYLTLFGLLLGFLSTFWAFGYTRLAAKLRQGVNEPEKTPTRATEICRWLDARIRVECVVHTDGKHIKTESFGPTVTEFCVLKSLTSGIIINIVGLGAGLLGMEATTGLLFAKSLSASFAVASPYAMNQVRSLVEQTCPPVAVFTHVPSPTGVPRLFTWNDCTAKHLNASSTAMNASWLFKLDTCD
eukprot:9479742-Pyramimonas_sp.AAC.1